MFINKKELSLKLNVSDYYTNYKNTQVLFFDIETTGLSKNFNYIYLIGIILYNTQKNSWYLYQYLINDNIEEKNLIIKFIDEMKKYDIIFHYNGTSFDLPFILKKCKIYGIDDIIIKNIKSIDLYNQLRKFKNILDINNLKLTTIEKRINYNRRDLYTGKELITYYKSYTITNEEKLKKNILLHNYEDLYTLTNILPLIKELNSLKNIKDYIEKTEKTIYDKTKNTLTITFNLKQNLLYNYSFYVNKNLITIDNENKKIIIIINLYNETLYYYFDNYKDYYYIPTKDKAIHKSVGTFMDKNKRINATKKNAYIRNRDIYIEISTSIDNIKIFWDKQKKQKYVLLNEFINKENHIKDFVSCLLK